MASLTPAPNELKPTLADVARRSGFAVSTVSAVLAQRPDCYASQKTRQKIIDAAQTLGFSPNLLARGLRGQSTHTIGMIVHSLSTHTLFEEYLRQIESFAADQGYRILLASSKGDPAREAQHIRQFVGQHVDGLIFEAPRPESQGLIEQVHRQAIPLVLIAPPFDSSAPCIRSDHAHGGYLQVKHLFDLGRDVLAFLITNESGVSAQRKIAGMQRAFAERGERYEDQCRLTWACTSRLELPRIGYELARELLDRQPGVNGIVASSDELAVGVLRALDDAGRRIPEDVAVVGYDDAPLAEFLTPPLTTIHMPRDLGHEAIAMLLKQVQASGGDAAPEPCDLQHRLEPHLLVRRSTVSLR